jgi:molybdate transport system ATP-binding protein
MSALEFDIRIRIDRFHLELAGAFALDGITAVFGPSGSGKSTLLRVLSGLERGASGRIAFRDETWLDTAARVFVEPHRRGVGYVFQDAQLLPFLSVAGNLRYAERRARRIPSDIRLDDVVGAFDLGALMAREPASLSGGERQRVAIARAVLTRPRLLLMDEPLSANDIARKADLLPYVRSLPAAFDVPVVYVSHAVDEVAYLADRLVVIGGGREIASGPVDTVLERLDLAEVTGPFEAGAVLTGRVARHDPAFRLTYVEHGEQAFVVPHVDADVGESLRLRVRARDVALATRRPENTSIRNVLAGTLIELVEDPATAFAEALVDIGPGHVRSRLTRASVAELGLAPGCTVYALIKSVSVDDRLTDGSKLSRPDC